MELVSNYTVKAITLAAKGAKNITGDYSFGSPVSVLAKVQYSEMEIKSVNDGTRKVSNIQVYLKPGVTVEQGYQAVVDSVNYIVEAVFIKRMFRKIVHKKAILV